MNVFPSSSGEKGALSFSHFISLLIWQCVFFWCLFVCFGAILILSHSICGPSIVVMEHYWMETWIEGRIKGTEERKELRKWVKEQRERRCQHVISLEDWTKREGRGPFLSNSLMLCTCSGVVHVLVCVQAHLYTVDLCTVPFCSIDLNVSLTSSSFPIGHKCQ